MRAVGSDTADTTLEPTSVIQTLGSWEQVMNDDYPDVLNLEKVGTYPAPIGQLGMSCCTEDSPLGVTRVEKAL